MDAFNFFFCLILCSLPSSHFLNIYIYIYIYRQKKGKKKK